MVWNSDKKSFLLDHELFKLVCSLLLSEFLMGINLSIPHFIRSIILQTVVSNYDINSSH